MRQRMPRSSQRLPRSLLRAPRLLGLAKPAAPLERGATYSSVSGVLSSSMMQRCDAPGLYLLRRCTSAAAAARRPPRQERLVPDVMPIPAFLDEVVPFHDAAYAARCCVERIERTHLRR